MNKLIEITALNSQGKEFPVELTIIPIKQKEKEFFCAFIRDITERKKAEDELRLSELRYRALIEQASDPIMITDQVGNFTDVNTSLCKMFGYTKEELVKLNVSKLIDPEQLKAQPIRFDRLAKGEHVFNERRMLRKDGTIVLVEANVKMIPDGRILAIARDITERKKAEVAIKESEERYRALVENAPEALVVFDVEKKGFVSVSKSAEELFKISKEELLKMGPIDLSPEYQPDGTLSSVRAMEKINEAINGGKPFFEWTHCDKDGNLIPCEIWLVRLPSEKHILIRGSIVDISLRKKAEETIRLSEQKYRLLFNKNPLPMWMISIPELRFIDVNDSAISQYGYSRGEFLAMSPMDLRPPEDKTRFLKESNKTLEGVNYVGIWRHRKKDGSVIRVEIYTHDVIYEGKAAKLALGNNITEKILAEEKLKLSHEKLRLLSSHLEHVREEERTNISREIHDELGQQLTGLKMEASWLNKKIPDSDKTVHKKIAGMISLIDETVKTVRRISSELRPRILDDLGLIDAIDWQTKEFEKRTGFRCKFNCKVDELRINKSLSTGIFRVYQETLTNVARHAHASEIKILLERVNGNLILKVHDNGKGFNEAEIKNKHTLGLTGMRERATIFGGALKIESKPGKGTTVLLKVPLKPSNDKINSLK